jgi:hypothetical protein
MLRAINIHQCSKLDESLKNATFKLFYIKKEFLSREIGLRRCMISTK